MSESVVMGWPLETPLERPSPMATGAWRYGCRCVAVLLCRCHPLVSHCCNLISNVVSSLQLHTSSLCHRPEFLPSSQPLYKWYVEPAHLIVVPGPTPSAAAPPAPAFRVPLENNPSLPPKTHLPLTDYLLHFLTQSQTTRLHDCTFHSLLSSAILTFQASTKCRTKAHRLPRRQQTTRRPSPSSTSVATAVLLSTPSVTFCAPADRTRRSLKLRIWKRALVEIVRLTLSPSL